LSSRVHCRIRAVYARFSSVGSSSTRCGFTGTSLSVKLGNENSQSCRLHCRSRRLDHFAESRKKSADDSIHVDSEVRLQLAVVCESFTHKRRASPSLGSLTIDRVQQSSHGGGPAAVEQIDLIDPIPNCAISTNRIRNHVVVRQVIRRKNVSATTENRPTKRID